MCPKGLDRNLEMKNKKNQKELAPSRQFYDYLPTRAQLELRQAQAEFFRSDWDWYLTLTIDRRVSEAQAWSILRRYLDALERKYGCPLGALIVAEKGRYSGLGMTGLPLHFHLVLRGCPQADPAVWEALWRDPSFGGGWCSGSGGRCHCGRKISGSAHVCRYDAGMSATFYLFKDSHIAHDHWDIHRPIHIGKAHRQANRDKDVRRCLRREKKRREEQLAPSKAARTEG